MEVESLDAPTLRFSRRCCFYIAPAFACVWIKKIDA